MLASAMVTPKYDPSVDFSNENLSQTLLALLAGDDRTVLDVGCATGYLAQMLRSRGCRVDGIEYDPVMAERAAPHVDRIETGDVQAMDLPALLGAQSYDVVVFGDVLEHLTEPQRVLTESLALLKPGGAIVASIPNVAHGAVRLQLLEGRFDYTSTGLLDETHVRFFTRETVLAMFEAAGLAIVEMRRTTAGLFETEVRVFEGDFEDDVVAQVLADPEATTYQFVLKAVPFAEADPAAVQRVRDAEAARLVEHESAVSRRMGGELELPSTPAARVGLWGSWDVDDLSQALLGRVVSAELARRLPGVLIRFFAPYGGKGGRRTGLGEPVEELGPHGAARRSALAQGIDAALVVGRIDTDPAVVAARHAQVPRDDEPALHLVDGPSGVPALWGPVSVDGGPVSAGSSLSSLTALPDPGLLASRVLPLAVASRRAHYLRSAGWLALSDRVVAVHLAGGTEAAPVVAALQQLADADPGLSVVVLEMDTTTGDGGAANQITAALPARALLLPVDGGIDSALAAIAISDLVVSTSATTRAIASSYGVPSADAADVGGLAALLKGGRVEAPDTGPLDAWFDQVASLVRAAVAPSSERALLSATERYAAMERAHAVMRARAWTDVQLASEATPRIELSGDAARADADKLRIELNAIRNTLTFRALERPRRAYSAFRRRRQ
ncbi:MAG: methyltransferase protein [Frankiales bacterium]|nr:methyltransferase protein [Frankiales bacterium]